MSDPSSANDVSKEGEALSPEWSFKWINPSRIEAGEMMAPARLSSPKARSFAALNLILEDLTFAHDCLKQAHEIGLPDSSNLQSKALIFSGVVSYARCFKSGVREVRLDSTELTKNGVHFDLTIHDYVVALRDKHVAHSVNEFERCEAVAIMVGMPQKGWRDGSGVGVIMQHSVGMSRDLLWRVIQHVEKLKSHISAEIEKERMEVYREFQESYAKEKKWEAAPILTIADRRNVAKRRR